MKSVLLWKEIIFSPFEGFKKVTPATKVTLPLLVLLILMTASTALILPIMQSEAYGQALIRSQLSALEEKGQEMSAEQQQAMIEQLNSPMVKNITIASAFGGGLVTFVAILLISSFLMMLIAKVFKGDLSFKMAFKILVYAGIFTALQALIKNGITLSGNYSRLLNQVIDTEGLRYALTSSISLAALSSPGSLGGPLFYLLDTFTDVFNWLYYIFIYTGLRSAAGLKKKQALGITLIAALCFILIGLVITLII